MPNVFQKFNSTFLFTFTVAFFFYEMKEKVEKVKKILIFIITIESFIFSTKYGGEEEK